MALGTTRAVVGILNPGEVVVCIRGTGQGFHGQMFAFPQEGGRVGRMPDCDVLINHPTISRYHCQLEVTSDGVRVRDLGSINGTWVNGVMGMEAWVHQGDVLRIGEVNFVVEVRPRTDFDPAGALMAPPVVDTTTTRLFASQNGKVQPIKYEDIRRERTTQKTRLTDLFRGRRGQ